MSGIRRFAAFAVSVCLLVALAPQALAASDERKTRPTVKVTGKDTIRPGAQADITITCGKPGFLSACVLDAEGTVVAVLCEEKETASGKSQITWDGMLENGQMAEKGAKYEISLSMRDEWGNEMKKDVVSALKIGDPRPAVTDVSFRYDETNKAWIISGTASMPGRLVIDLHVASDLENKYLNVVSGYEKSSKEAQMTEEGERFSYVWNGKIKEEEGKETNYYPLDPGYYALSVYLDDKDNVRSEKSILYVSVNADKARTPYLTGEEPEGFSVSMKAEDSGNAQSDGGEDDAQAEETEQREDGETEAEEEAEVRLAGPNESIKGEDGYTLGVVMGEEGLQIGAGVSDTAQQEDGGYWTLRADATDEQIWAALTRTMTSVDEEERNSVSVLATPESDGKKIAQVNGLTQGLNVVGEVGEWSIVEVFRNEDSAFTRGYIRTSRLRTVEPDQEYGVTIDKATQTLTVWHNGERVGSVPVCTGLATPEHPERETPAGEFILATRMGTREMQMGFCEYAIRISGDVWLHEIPSTRRKGSDFSELEDMLGEKVTRRTIAVAHESSEDGAINMEWIWKNLDRKRVKVLIFDDKERDVVPYLNPAQYQ